MPIPSHLSDKEVLTAIWLMTKIFLNVFIQNKFKHFYLLHNDRLAPQTAATSKIEQVKT